MLEATELILSHTDGRVRPIVADTGLLVGSARWRTPQRRWWWMGGTLLEVRETDDEPLLFTIRRRWGLWPRYDIRDADGVNVGSLKGRQLYDARGLLLARLCSARGTKDCRWEGATGAVLAEVGEATKSTRLQFVEARDDNPFVRMLLLAAMLILYP